MEITTMHLALLSPGLMLLGYAFYIGLSLKRDVDPNPTTWVMFAYGTALLFFLELDTLSWQWSDGITVELVILLTPAACALSSIYVAFLCFKRGTWKLIPDEWKDGVSFATDVLLTIGYVTAWILLALNYISSGDRELWTIIFLVGSNLTTLTAFYPILRHTKRDPSVERALPWMIWTASYVTLGVVTMYQHGLLSVLMIYPALNSVLHFSMGWFAMPHRRKKKLKEAFVEF